MIERTDRLNSLLKEVISDVIRKEVKNPDVHELFTVTRVKITKDLQEAKVYISVIANETESKQTIKALQSAAGFIGMRSAKQVVMRLFPKLSFVLDDSVSKQIRIQELLDNLSPEQ